MIITVRVAFASAVSVALTDSRSGGTPINPTSKAGISSRSENGGVGAVPL
jgi:hypothetical protein